MKKDVAVFIIAEKAKAGYKRNEYDQLDRRSKDFQED